MQVEDPNYVSSKVFEECDISEANESHKQFQLTKREPVRNGTPITQMNGTG